MLRLVAEGVEVGCLHFREEPCNVDVLNALAPKQVECALSRVHWHTRALDDPLTGLYNRRAFELHAANLTKRALRHGQPVSLAILDIDHFKRVNGRYGHPTGDEVLKVLAGTLRCNTRSEDLVLRWGGEEFVLLLYGSTLAQLETGGDPTRFNGAHPLCLRSAGASHGRPPRSGGATRSRSPLSEAIHLRRA